jgi:hypothetical protein
VLTRGNAVLCTLLERALTIAKRYFVLLLKLRSFCIKLALSGRSSWQEVLFTYSSNRDHYEEEHDEHTNGYCETAVRKILKR